MLDKTKIPRPKAPLRPWRACSETSRASMRVKRDGFRGGGERASAYAPHRRQSGAQFVPNLTSV